MLRNTEAADSRSASIDRFDQQASIRVLRHRTDRLPSGARRPPARVPGSRSAHRGACRTDVLRMCSSGRSTPYFSAAQRARHRRRTGYRCRAHLRRHGVEQNRGRRDIRSRAGDTHRGPAVSISSTISSAGLASSAPPSTSISSGLTHRRRTSLGPVRQFLGVERLEVLHQPGASRRSICSIAASLSDSSTSCRPSFGSGVLGGSRGTGSSPSAPGP